MKYVIAGWILNCAVLGLYFSLQYVWIKQKQYVENRLLAVLAFASGVWSLGFGLQVLQENPEHAYMCRVVGMIGTMLYLIVAQMLVDRVSGLSKRWTNLFDGIAYFGVLVYFFSIEKESIIYHWDKDYGMTYRFAPGLGNTLYTIYGIIIGVNVFLVTLYMLYRSKDKRLVIFGKRFMWAVIFLMLGMVLDTVLPLCGITAIPGSTIMQFFGMVVLRAGVHEMNRSRINMENMSEFVYYSLAVPVIVYDHDYQIQLINNAASAFFEVEQSVVEERNVSLDELFELEEEDVYIFDGVRRDVDVVCKRNGLYCSLAINKIHDTYGDVIGYIVIVTDLTERIKTMHALEEAKETADSANKAKSTFLANMSHEIRTPMNVIIGFSELILKMEISKHVKECVQDIKDASENLLALINDLLDISKIESGKMELICADYYTNTLFKDVYLIINAQAKRKGLEFKMSIASDMPSRLNGDKVRIRGILINLLTNAVKYTSAGSISLEAQFLDMNEDVAKIAFCVTDTGVGIKEEELDHIFDSFTQVNRKMHHGVEGTGLGLSIVKGYVELMNGEIKVSSTYGEGSVFTAIVEQKIVDASPMDAIDESEMQATNDFRLGSIKVVDTQVLVVDDNLINLKVATSTLGYYGLKVDIASNGMDAVAMCHKKEYDMVFMDQMMPQMDGVETMQEIRTLGEHYKTGGKAKIIVLTANAVAGVRQQLMSLGFDEYLGKPMNFKQLERLLLRFLPSERIVLNDEEESKESEEDKMRREISERLPNVDLEKGITFCGGRPSDYLSILLVTYRNGAKTVQDLLECQRKGDYTNYTILVHGLKSTTMSIGAEEISQCAKEQEAAGKSGEYALIDAQVGVLTKAYNELLDEIKEVLLYYHMIDEQDFVSEKKMWTKEQVLAFMQEIVRHLDTFDFAGASVLLREIDMSCLSETDGRDIEQLRVWMNEMDEDNIRAFVQCKNSRIKEN